MWEVSHWKFKKKSSVVEVSNSNFLVSKVFYTDGEIPACPKISCAKARTGKFAALLCKIHLIF